MFFSTKQAAKALGVRIDTLSRAVWLNRIEAPTKSPSGNFLWTLEDINRVSWALFHKAYEPPKAKLPTYLETENDK